MQGIKNLQHFILIPHLLKWDQKDVLEKVMDKKLSKFWIFQILNFFLGFLPITFWNSFWTYIKEFRISIEFWNFWIPIRISFEKIVVLVKHILIVYAKKISDILQEVKTYFLCKYYLSQNK